ncbi:hypothetical protein ACINWCA157_2146 [Acinetobacter radioresistens WC-A-157]|nr:hypothetical protein [Acinetobacter radioresistens]EJO36325.1 hypothetical protein ACINWCA157_2146 [Acinetobacter radioresistens WC-A-157]
MGLVLPVTHQMKALKREYLLELAVPEHQNQHYCVRVAVME